MDDTWVDSRGIEQKSGRKRGSFTDVLQKCQVCGRWVYVLTELEPDQNVCGGCFSRIITPARGAAPA